MELNVEAPVNGRVHKADVTVREDGRIVFQAECNMSALLERRRLSKRLAERFGGKAEEIEKKLEDHWAQAVDERRKAQKKENATATPGNQITCRILDDAPGTIRRPLSLVDGRAYAATCVPVQTTAAETVDPKTGAVTRHDPPLVRTTSTLAILRDDGQMFGDGVPDAQPLAKLGIEVALPSPLPPNQSWSGAGVRRYLREDRPLPADVFERVTLVVDYHMDFNRSLAPQGTMCELVACYILGTYFLPAFNVIGSLWSSGGWGAGKTNLLIVVAELGYLGLVILAGGSYASLRDLADYGAVLCFDDAEGVMDVRKADPDKRALLLAGNRRGALITVKEPKADRGWVTRYIDAFCPRSFSAIRLPDAVLGSRSIIVPLIRSGDGERAKRNPVDHQAWPRNRRQLLDDLWATGLTFLPEMSRYDVEAARRSSMTGRNLDSWRSILAVALWLQEAHGVSGVYERMTRLSTDYQGERTELEMSDAVIVAIKALQQMVEGADPTGELVIETKELTGRMNAIAQEEELVDPDKSFTNSRKVGWLLKQQRFRKADGRTARRWKTSRAQVEAMARTYGLITDTD